MPAKNQIECRASITTKSDRKSIYSKNSSNLKKCKWITFTRQLICIIRSTIIAFQAKEQPIAQQARWALTPSSLLIFTKKRIKMSPSTNLRQFQPRQTTQTTTQTQHIIPTIPTTTNHMWIHQQHTTPISMAISINIISLTCISTRRAWGPV